MLSFFIYRIAKIIYPKYTWKISSLEKKVYLTFDDGPTPDITEWVLSELKKYNAKATFFCIGKNIEERPTIFKKILQDGHAIGNHTQNHLNGWKTNTTNYIENTKNCESVIATYVNKNNNLFRPPYGRIKKIQSNQLLNLGYKIIMWDVLSKDYSKKISPEKCLKNVIENVRPGSIIVFHDSVKASQNLMYVLPKTLQYLSEQGYSFEKIN